MNLYVIRHGETDWNKRFVLQGATDIPLNENGLQQAKEASLLLKDIKFDHIYVSPLTRTKQTLENLNLSCKNIIIEPEIIERNFGAFEGTQTDTKSYWNYELNLSSNNVEAIQHFFYRIYTVLNKIIKEYENTDKNIILVTHNGVQMAINFLLNDYPTTDNILALRIPPCNFKIYNNPKIINKIAKEFEKNESINF